MAEIDYSIKSFARKDKVCRAHIAVDGKARQRAISRPADLLQNGDAFLNTRREEATVPVRRINYFQLPMPERPHKPWVF
jgi:hypothetical protein